MYETITSPLNYGGLVLKNRIIFAPTSMGLPMEEQVAYLRRLAAGGCAMIIIGDVPVLPGKFGPSLYSKKGFAYYKAMVDAVHSEGCRICAQLHQSDSNLKGMLKYIPGVLTKKISMEELRPPSEPAGGALHHRPAGGEDSPDHRGLRQRRRKGGGGRL